MPGKDGAPPEINQDDPSSTEGAVRNKGGTESTPLIQHNSSFHVSAHIWRCRELGGSVLYIPLYTLYTRHIYIPIYL